MLTSVLTASDVSVSASPTNHETRADGHGISLRQTALIAGLGLLLLAVLAAFANFGVLQRLIVSGDAKSTAQNIEAAQGLFRIAIGSFFVVAILDVVVAWALYIWFQPINRSLSL